MSLQVGIRQLKDHLSRYMERVEGGESVTVTKRGRPIADIRPTRLSAVEPGLAEMIAEGKATWSGKMPKLPRRVEVDKPFSLSDIVVEEREKHR